MKKKTILFLIMFSLVCNCVSATSTVMLKNTSAKELSNFIITNFVVPGNGQLLWQTDNSIAINLKSYSQNTFNQVMFGNDVQCRYTFNFAPIDND